MDKIKKISWQERCKLVQEFHSNKLLSNPKWSIRETAKDLNMSIGSISQFLQLASWLRSHPKLENVKDLTAALEFIKDKKFDMRINK